MRPRERAKALVVTGVAVVAVALPGVRVLASGDAPDGFPLSTYPMFGRDPGREVDVPTVVAIDEGGGIDRLSPTTIAGTDQVIQAAVTVRRAIDGGPAAAAALCREVADRVDAGSTVALVVERHDAVAWAGGDDEPLDRRTVASCEAGG